MTSLQAGQARVSSQHPEWCTPEESKAISETTEHFIRNPFNENDPNESV